MVSGNFYQPYSQIYQEYNSLSNCKFVDKSFVANEVCLSEKNLSNNAEEANDKILMKNNEKEKIFSIVDGLLPKKRKRGRPKKEEKLAELQNLSDKNQPLDLDKLIEAGDLICQTLKSPKLGKEIKKLRQSQLVEKIETLEKYQTIACDLLKMQSDMLRMQKSRIEELEKEKNERLIMQNNCINEPREEKLPKESDEGNIWGFQSLEEQPSYSIEGELPIENLNFETIFNEEYFTSTL